MHGVSFQSPPQQKQTLKKRSWSSLSPPLPQPTPTPYAATLNGPRRPLGPPPRLSGPRAWARFRRDEPGVERGGLQRSMAAPDLRGPVRGAAAGGGGGGAGPQGRGLFGGAGGVRRLCVQHAVPGLLPDPSLSVIHMRTQRLIGVNIGCLQVYMGWFRRM